jgi:hypothetical protein
MRWLFLIALAACGQKESAPRDAARPPADAAPLGVGGLAGRIPRLTTDTIALATPPLAAVVIDKDGAIRVAATNSDWTRVIAPGFGTTEPVLQGSAAVQDAILAIAKQAGVDTDDLASELAETRAEEPAPTEAVGPGTSGYGWGGAVTYDIDMAISYAALPGEELPPTTPLLIVAPEIAGAQLAGALDDVGGVVLVDDDGRLRALATRFPWSSAAGGGAELDEGADEPALDVVAGQPGVVFVPGPNAELAPLPAVKDALLRHKGAAVVTDVLVAIAASAQHVVDALAALDAAGAPRLGVGERPVPMQTFDPLGKPLDGRARDDRSQLLLGSVDATTGLDPTTIRRYVKRHIAKYKYCFDKARLAKPELAGSVLISFTVSPIGAITQVDATGVDDEIDTCVEAVVRATQFPSPKDGAIVTAKTSLTLRLD